MRALSECYLHERCKKFAEKTCNPSDEFCIKLFKEDTLFDEGLFSETQRKYQPLYIDEDESDKEVFSKLKLIEQNVSKFFSTGNNLYLYSTITGNGKTAWALRLAQDYIDTIWYKSDLSCKVLFINVPRYLSAVKENFTEKSDYSQHIKENILLADIVIWDDIATKDATVFETEHLLSIINTRIDSNLSNIYTSNVMPQQLQDCVGARLSSRIIGMSYQYEFKGKDKRIIFRGAKNQ